jgi:hypothetical protein
MEFELLFGYNHNPNNILSKYNMKSHEIPLFCDCYFESDYSVVKIVTSDNKDYNNFMEKISSESLLHKVKVENNYTYIYFNKSK